MKFNLIDIENWKRKPYFNHYLNNIRCTYSMTANIEISDMLEKIKDKNIKIYPTLLYMITTIVNRHVEFRTCFNSNGELGYFNEMSPSYTIFNKDSETFSSIWSEYNNSFKLFYENYNKDVECYGKIEKIFPKENEPINTFPVSSVPWVSFTGFNLNIYEDGKYLLPIFTIGKYFKQENKTLLPISIQAHHAVCDGFHVSRFINELQEMVHKQSQWLL